MNLMDYNINLFLFAVMMSIRLGAFFKSMPIFSSVKLTVVVVAVLPLTISFLLAPIIAYDIMPLMNSGIIAVTFAIITEVFVGIIMGFSLNVVMTLATMTGHLTGMNAGLIMASFFDPSLGQVSLLGIFLRNIFMLAFFLFNIHHALIWLLIKSYDAIPVGSDFLSFVDLLPGLVKLFSSVFFMSFRLVLPIIVIILLSHLTMGIVQITAPQMNIYFNAAITLNIVVALIFFMISIPTILNYFGVSLGLLDEFLTSLLVVVK